MVDLTGQTAMQACGLSATVIKCNDNNTVDVRFKDGTVVRNQSFKKFMEGKVHYPIRDYTGLSGTDKYGNHFIIMKFSGRNNMDVLFNGYDMRYNIKEADLGINLYRLANRHR